MDETKKHQIMVQNRPTKQYFASESIYVAFSSLLFQVFSKEFWGCVEWVGRVGGLRGSKIH